MDKETILEPGERIRGVDAYAVNETANRILLALAEAGWNIGEVELLPDRLTKAIEENQKRIHNMQPFLVVPFATNLPPQTLHKGE
jgi:hypothetical protein